MTLSRKASSTILIVILALLGLGWAWGAWRNWGEIASRPVRLAYLICDLGLVLPAGLVAAFGLRGAKPWAPTLFAFVLGALVFDIAHGMFYLLWDNYFHLPVPVAFGMLAVLLVYAVSALRGLNAPPT